MNADKLRGLSKVLTVVVSVLTSLVAGLLLAYFTNIIFKAQVVYTISGYKINLPEKYEKELAKIRAKAVIKDFETFLGKVSKKDLRGKAIIENEGIYMKPGELSALGPKRDSVGAVGKDIDRIIETLEKPEVLRSFLDSSVSYPTAFATVEIKNTGNREATDMEIKILPNGVLVEARVDSSEPSTGTWNNVLDNTTGLPVGIHFPAMKRLPPEGYLKVRLYWHMLDSSKQDTDVPTITVRGTYTGGKLIYVESQPQTGPNWPLIIIICIALLSLGAGLGYWIRYLKNS